MKISSFKSIRAMSRAAFTLSEMLMAIGLSALLIAGMVVFFVNQRRASNAMAQVNDMTQSLRIALDAVTADLRTAGYGAPIINIATWVPWVSGVTSAVSVVQGASGSADIMYLVGAFDDPAGTLSAASAAGSTTITLQSGQGAKFDTSKKKVIFVGRCENARIVSISGDTLTVSVDPTASGFGLRYAYPDGTPVELVQVVTYSWGNDYAPYGQYLKRWENIGTVANEWQKMIASNIEDFQITGVGKRYSISISGRTGQMDPWYKDPVKGDHYRRTQMSINCQSRQP